jgi:hypothetical protein
VIALLILASIVDVLLGVLLIAVSGFVFGGGPEGGHGELTGVAMWTIGMLSCTAAPILGFVLRSLGRPGIGALVAWLPPIAALLITFAPYHPY